MEILIVDDTSSVQLYVKMLLAKGLNISTTSAFNGAEAIEVLLSGRTFDLILLDWEMPVLNGPGTLELFRNMKLTIPVIMMTNKNSSEDIIKILELGAAEYIMKPFTIDILFEKIETVLGRKISYAA